MRTRLGDPDSAKNDILAALVISSQRGVLDLMPPSEDTGEAPFIWTPTEGA
jgi:hypothetical protein